MARLIRCSTLLSIAALLEACATTGVDAVVEPTITVSEPRPIDPSEDPLNVAMLAALTPGMLMTIHISPRGIELQQAVMMLTPKTSHPPGGEDQVVVTLYGGGAKISQAAIADPTILIVEGQGEFPQEDRVVSLAATTPHPVDTVEVTVTATGETRTFDVSAVMASYCASTPREPSCEPAARP